MWQFSAFQSFRDNSNTSLLSVGRAPGCHVQTGQIFVFGIKVSKFCSFLHWQKILFGLLNFIWISNQIVFKYIF